MQIIYIGKCEAVKNSFGEFKKDEAKEVSEEIGKILLGDPDNWKDFLDLKKKVKTKKEG